MYITVCSTTTSRDIDVIWIDGASTFINVNKLLFISHSLHGWEITIWSGTLIQGELIGEVVIKDCWIDPLWPHMEGRILTMLNKAGMVSVPKLLLKQQVKTEHPAKNAFVNSLIHILQSLISTLLTTPCITWIFSHVWWQSSGAIPSSTFPLLLSSL